MIELKKINWIKIILFYSTILITTFLARKLPNILYLIYSNFTDIYFPWNYNHGLAVLLVTFVFYKFYFNKKSEFSLLGTHKLKSLLFPIILFTGYTIYGIQNDQGVNIHLWAFIFCLSTLVYDLMEEYAWRGYLIENLGKLNLLLKSCISGVFWAIWHVLIFNDFDQYGGFFMFLILCVIFSVLLTFSVIKTKSILVAATLHALLIKTNVVTLIMLCIFLLLLFTWNKTYKKMSITN